LHGINAQDGSAWTVLLFASSEPEIAHSIRVIGTAAALSLRRSVASVRQNQLSSIVHATRIRTLACDATNAIRVAYVVRMNEWS
jgi:hypothetical protein